MARLALSCELLRRAHMQDRNRIDECRKMRYAQRAFKMSDEEFFDNFRVPKSLFQYIYSETESVIPATRRKSEISTRYKLLVALSFFSTGGYQRLVGGNHGTIMSQQSVSRCVKVVYEAINDYDFVNKWIKFPKSPQEINYIKRRFFKKFGIPGIVGCIDGTNIAIIRPKENEERYFNRKHFHSWNVQIICDADGNIISVDVSFGGASDDNFVWNQHPIKRHMIDLINNGDNNVYLLGDLGYPQSRYMMTPIINAVPGSPEEHYNNVHCAAHNTVERTISNLKDRWQCLLSHKVLHYHPDVAAKIIIACCVLHNMCNQVQLPKLDVNIPYPPEFDGNLAVQENVQELQQGLLKRMQLVQQLWEARNAYSNNT